MIRHPDMRGELLEWAAYLHRECRLTEKWDMQPCGCDCGHPCRALRRRLRRPASRLAVAIEREAEALEVRAISHAD